MKGFFNRGGDKELERRLRDERPEPRPEFLAMLTERIESRRPRRRTSVRTRVALVGAVTAALLIATSAVGGLAYAGTALKTVVVTAKTVVTAPVVSFKSHELSDKSAKVSNTQQGHGNDNKGNTQEQVGHGTPPPPQPGHGDDGHGGKPDDHQYGHKVTICFRGHTLTIDRSALPAFLALRATLGACPTR